VRDGALRRDLELPARQGVLLFVYLVLHRGSKVSRDLLTEAIWPTGGPSATDSALNALLSKLRRALGVDWLEGGSNLTLRLPETAIVDLEAAREGIHRAESAASLEHWADAWGPARVALHTAARGFLPGFDAPWIDDVRREVEGIETRALECVAAAGLGLGGPELASAERSGRRLIELSGYNESGYRYLMEALARRDQVAEALRVYEQLRVLLQSELGIPPGKSVQKLHARLLGARGA
jgi:SARP family transcriptional regulator, regulator of embCAB operon